jgi:hypothetical protein
VAESGQKLKLPWKRRNTVLYKKREKSYTIRQETERRGNSSAQDFAFGAKSVTEKPRG